MRHRRHLGNCDDYAVMEPLAESAGGVRADGGRRDAWPVVAQAGDGNAWVMGACWLYCRREGVAVLWVGSVATPGAAGDVYACGLCLAELTHMVRVQSHHRGRVGDRAAQSAAHTGPAHAPLPRALPAGASEGRH